MPDCHRRFSRVSRAGAACLAALLLLAGCTTAPPAPAPEQAEPALPSLADTRFTIAATNLDTWNAVGQLLVRMEGVVYEGRSQKLGLYAVRYRDAAFLVLTKPRVLDDPHGPVLTEVSAVLPDGKPNLAGAAVDLLDALERELPAELARIAAGERSR
jgi:hypothetical protein